MEKDKQHRKTMKQPLDEIPDGMLDFRIGRQDQILFDQTDTGHLAKETDLFFGIDHSRLFLALQHKLLCVLKAILLEAKVLVQSSASACLEMSRDQ